MGGESKSDMRGDGDNFLVSLGILLLGGGVLRLSVVLGGVVVFGCRVVSVKLVDFDVMVLELDSYCFYLDLGGVMKWTSGKIVGNLDINVGFLGECCDW